MIQSICQDFTSQQAISFQNPKLHFKNNKNIAKLSACVQLSLRST